MDDITDPHGRAIPPSGSRCLEKLVPPARATTSPDDPKTYGPPRFPSELTLYESKSILGLDDDAYVRLRAKFTQLCQQAGVINKTIAGPERWDAHKDSSSRVPRRGRAWQSPTTTTTRSSPSTSSAQMSPSACACQRRPAFPPGACVTLGIDPGETRQIRASFYRLVEEKGLHSKTQAGIRQWNDLKNDWASQSPIIQRVLAPATTPRTRQAQGPGDPGAGRNEAAVGRRPARAEEAGRVSGCGPGARCAADQAVARDRSTVRVAPAMYDQDTPLSRRSERAGAHVRRLPGPAQRATALHPRPPPAARPPRLPPASPSSMTRNGPAVYAEPAGAPRPALNQPRPSSCACIDVDVRDGRQHLDRHVVRAVRAGAAPGRRRKVPGRDVPAHRGRAQGRQGRGDAAADSTGTRSSRCTWRTSTGRRRHFRCSWSRIGGPRLFGARESMEWVSVLWCPAQGSFRIRCVFIVLFSTHPRLF